MSLSHSLPPFVTTLLDTGILYRANDVTGIRKEDRERYIVFDTRDIHTTFEEFMGKTIGTGSDNMTPHEWGECMRSIPTFLPPFPMTLVELPDNIVALVTSEVLPGAEAAKLFVDKLNDEAREEVMLNIITLTQHKELRAFSATVFTRFSHDYATRILGPFMVFWLAKPNGEPLFVLRTKDDPWDVPDTIPHVGGLIVSTELMGFEPEKELPDWRLQEILNDLSELGVFFSFYVPLYLGFCWSLLTCKNVTVNTNRLNRQQLRHRVRENVPHPAIEWKTITIAVPPLHYRASPTNRDIKDHHGKRLHLARAHFAEYGMNGKGKLFGKIEGRFLIRPHFRGDPSLGKIVNDYKLVPRFSARETADVLSRKTR